MNEEPSKPPISNYPRIGDMRKSPKQIDLFLGWVSGDKDFVLEKRNGEIPIYVSFPKRTDNAPFYFNSSGVSGNWIYKSEIEIGLWLERAREYTARGIFGAEDRLMYRLVKLPYDPQARIESLRRAFIGILDGVRDALPLFR